MNHGSYYKSILRHHTPYLDSRATSISASWMTASEASREIDSVGTSALQDHQFLAAKVKQKNNLGSSGFIVVVVSIVLPSRVPTAALDSFSYVSYIRGTGRCASGAWEPWPFPRSSKKSSSKLSMRGDLGFFSDTEMAGLAIGTEQILIFMQKWRRAVVVVVVVAVVVNVIMAVVVCVYACAYTCVCVC